jgi:hypothetical protein
MSYKVEYVEFLISDVKKVSEKAVLISLANGEDIWVPRVTLPKLDDDLLDDMGTGYSKGSIRIAKWFCLEKGLI